MDVLTTELALFGMIVLGTTLCLLGFWVEVRHRRYQQREDSRRQHVFIQSHDKTPGPAPATGPAPLVAELHEDPEPVAHGR